MRTWHSSMTMRSRSPLVYMVHSWWWNGFVEASSAETRMILASTLAVDFHYVQVMPVAVHLRIKSSIKVTKGTITIVELANCKVAGPMNRRLFQPPVGSTINSLSNTACNPSCWASDLKVALCPSTLVNALCICWSMTWAPMDFRLA